MSKKTSLLCLLMTLLFVFSASLWAQANLVENGNPFRIPGSTCVDPMIMTLPVIDYMDNTEDYGDNYSSDWITPSSSYLNGNDFVVQFTMTEPGYLSGSVSGSWTGLFILDQCPDEINPAPVFASATGSSGGSFADVPLFADTYFAIVSTWPSPQFTDFTLNLSFDPFPEYDLEITNLTGNLSVVAGETDTYQIEIVNMGTENDTYDLSITGDTWTYSAPATVSVDAGETATVEVDVTVPATAGMGDTDEINFTATSQGDITVSDSILITTTALGDAITNFPWGEGFENEWPPVGWTVVNGEPGAYWEQSSVAVNTGDYSARSYQGSGSSYVADEWLITPALDLDAATEYMLSFYGYSSQAPNGDREKMRIMIMDEVYTNVVDLHANATEIDLKYFTGNWEEYFVDLAGYSGEKHLAFHYYITENIGFNWIYVDDVLVFEKPDYDLKLTNLSGDMTGQAGTTITYELEIENRGTLNDTYDLSITGDEWTYTYPATIAVDSGETGIVMLEVAVPSDANMGDTDDITFTATSQGDNTITDSVDIVSTALAVVIAPYFENFDGVSTPDLPVGWSKIVEHPTSTSPRVETSTSGTPYSPPNHARLYSNDEVDADILLITPPVADLDQSRIRFWAKCNLSTNVPDLIVGTITDPNDAATFTPFETIVADTELTNVYAEFMVHFDTYVGTDQYIAFKFGLTPQFFRSIYIDDFMYEEIPAAPVLFVSPDSYDFSATTGGTSPAAIFTLNNTGLGTLTITDGDIVFTGADADQFFLGAITYPIEINSGESDEIEVFFAPTTEGDKTATMEITHNGTNSPYDVPLSGFGYPESTVIFGTGTNVNGTTTANPINIYYRSLRGQMVYHASELLAAGIEAGDALVEFGFYVEQTPLHPLPDFVIRMKHTEEDDVSAHDDGPFELVYHNVSYAPVEGDWDVLTLDTPFVWNGVDNILVDTAFDQVPSYNSSGQQRIYDVPNGFRFVRSDGSNQTNVPTTTVSSNKPQAMMIFGEPPDLGTIEGIVTLIGGTGNVTDVEVTVEDYMVNPDATGFYSIDITPGTYDVTASLLGYETQTIEDVVVLEGLVTPDIDFDLGNIEIAVTPTSFDVTLDPDQTEIQTMTITNDGAAELEFSISIIELDESRFSSFGSSSGGIFNPGHTSSRYAYDSRFNDKAFHTDDLSYLPEASDDIFDLLDHFPVGVGGGEYSVSTDGNYIYTAAWNSTTFYRYETNGTYIGEFTVAGAGNLRDMTFDGEYFYGSNNSSTIYEMDLANETLVSSFTTTGSSSIRAIAYDPDEDGFWVTNGWNAPFTLIDRSGSVIETLTSTIGSISGLAWEDVSDDGPYLWAYTQTAGTNQNSLVQVDMVTGDALQTFDVTTTGVLAADAISGGVDITNQLVPGKWTFLGTSQNDVIWVIELGDSVEWILASPTSGVVDPGDSIDIDIIFDSHEIAMGIYSADIVVSHNAGDDPVVVPATLNVTGAVALPFYEDFSGVDVGEIPAGWDRTHTNWGVTDSNNAGGEAPEMRFSWTPSGDDTFILTTPMIDASGASELELKLKHMVDDYDGGYTLKLQSSTDGTTWIDEVVIEPVASIPAEEVTVDLDHLAGQAFQLAAVFIGDSYDINYWYIDDVEIYDPGIVYEPEIVVTPTSFDVAVPEDQLITEILTIGNIGNADLTFTLTLDGDPDLLDRVTLVSAGDNVLYDRNRNFRNNVRVDWLSVDPMSGTVAPSDEIDIDVTFDADGLDVGTYTADIIIEHNAGEDIIVPCNMVVYTEVVFIDEDFSGAWPPAGWEVTSTGANINWEQSSTNNAGGVAPEARFYWSPSTLGVQRLITPELNTSAFTALVLEFRNFNNDFSGGYELRLETTSDGVNWNTVQTFPSTDFGPQLEEIVVQTPDVGSDTFQMAWTFDGDSWDINWWCIDDVLLAGAQDDGAIEGTVTLIGGTGDVTDVEITANGITANPDATGFYSIPMYPGLYDVTASLYGYQTETVSDVIVLENQVTVVDFDLGNIDIAVTPDEFDVVVAPGSIITETMTITNDGAGDLEYSISVQQEDSRILGFRTRDTRIKAHQPIVNRISDVSGSDRDPRPSYASYTQPTDDIFDLLDWFAVGVGGGEYSVTTDGDHIYTAAWNSTSFYRYETDGTYIGEFTIAGAGNLRDLSYDGQYFYGSPNSSTIYEMDFASEILISSITTSVATIRSIAYDAENDGFWVGSGWSPAALQMVDRTGTVVETLPTTVGSISGMAWEDVSDGGPYLWAYTQTAGTNQNDLVQIDMTTGAELQTFDVTTTGVLAGDAISGGLDITDELVAGKWTFIGTSQNDVIWVIELGDAGPLWLYTDPTSGIVEAGQSVVIDVMFDATDPELTPGAYEADIVISHNAPEDPVVIPVTMVVYTDDPIITVSPDEFDVTMNPDEIHVEELTIGNIGGADLTFSIDAEEDSRNGISITDRVSVGLSTTNELRNVRDTRIDWLSFNPDSGTVIPYETIVVDVTFDSNGLEAGEYTANIIIENNAGEDVVVPVTLNVTGAAEISVTPDEFDVDIDYGDVITLPMTITNDGDIDLDFSISVVEDGYRAPAIHGRKLPTGPVTAYRNSYSNSDSTPVGFQSQTRNPLEITSKTNARNHSVKTNNNYRQPIEIHYDGGYDNNGVGTGGVASWYSAARFTAEELATYYGGYEIMGIKYHIRDPQFTNVTVKVWEGGSFGDPGVEVYSHDVTGELTVGDWSTHNLTMPVPLLEGNEYWIGYSIDATGDHPASVDAGPMEPEKGGWIALAGGAWELLTEYNLNYNWCIRGLVDELTEPWLSVAPISGTVPAGESMVVDVTFNATEVLANTTYTADLVITNNAGDPVIVPVTMNVGEEELLPPANFTAEVVNVNNVQLEWDQPATRAVTGYYIYMNGTQIAEIGEAYITEYLVEGLDDGAYNFYATAIYDDVLESDPSNDVDVEIELLPPVNFNAQIQNVTNVMCNWEAPAGATNITHYRVYRNGEQVGQVTTMFYVDMNVPAGTHTYHATALYNEEFESEPSNEVEIDMVDADDTIVPTVTELRGNYPNPFNPETTIAFSLKNASHVTIEIFNIKGEKVRTLVDKELHAAYHNIVWDGRDNRGRLVSSGIFFYRMKTDEYNNVRKMIMMK